MFKVISCGWNCAQYMEQTFESIYQQSRSDWVVGIGYCADLANDEGLEIITKWANLDHRFKAMVRPVEVMDTENRYTTIADLQPNDDDIIITLDLDGDQLAHPRVLEHLVEYYADGTLLTYGNYEPVPYDPGCPPALAYPPDVVAARSYRAYGRVLFNHLRTMKGTVFSSIPQEQFKFASGPKAGEWYHKGSDVQFTFCGLELVGQRHKVINEVLMHYNSANPLSNWRIAPEQTDECNLDFLARPPLPELP